MLSAIRQRKAGADSDRGGGGGGGGGGEGERETDISDRGGGGGGGGGGRMIYKPSGFACVAQMQHVAAVASSCSSCTSASCCKQYKMPPLAHRTFNTNYEMVLQQRPPPKSTSNSICF